MLKLETQEEKEFWKQMIVAYLAGRNGEAVHHNAADVADRYLEHLRKRDNTKADSI